MSSPFEGKGKGFFKVALLVFLFALLTVTGAAANSISYTFSATFSNGQHVNGTLSWDSATNWVTAYSYSLSGAAGQATCSSQSLCGWLAGAFSGKQVVGMLSRFSMGGSNYIYLTTKSGTWSSTVSVPEEVLSPIS
jgi:hypothetical protein